jgi:hypothetical protein
MVDDGANVARTAQLLRAEVRLVLCLQASVGFVHSWEKCHLHPAPAQEFLGFIVDLQSRRFIIPQRKLDRFGDLLQRAISGPDFVACRSALGVLASLSPALPMAHLLGRWLRLATAADKTPDHQDLRLLEFWHTHLDRLNGRSWDYRNAPVLELNAERALHRATTSPPGASTSHLRLVSDASETAFGAFLTDDPTWQMATPFTHEQRQAVVNNEFSSTEREVRGFLTALTELQRSGRLCDVSHVQIWTDSQPAYVDCVRMRGVPPVFRAV